MIIKLKNRQPDLQIAHQSEVVTLQKQLQRMQHQINVLTEKLQSSESDYDTPKASDMIKISKKHGVEWIVKDQIIYCEAQGNYSKIYTQDERNENKTKTYVVSRSLKSLAEQLSSSCFIRCHQSYLINKNHVLRFVSKGGPYLTMRNQQNVSVSRRRKHVLSAIFMK